MPNALVSVSDKTGLESFIRRLERFSELRLIATASTARFLTDAGFSCVKVEDLTKFPEILSGRVKTLHPKVLGGILSRPSSEDRRCLAEHEIEEIDIVIVNLYPFEKKLEEGLPEHEMVEQIDIGGVTLLRAAAKNFERVAVISDPNQYDTVIEALDANSGTFPEGLRKELSFQAFLRTARYDASISSYLGERLDAGGLRDEMPGSIFLSLEKVQDLRYGENPHHSAGWYGCADKVRKYDCPLPPFRQRQGKELSSNNITDAYACVRVLQGLSGAATCIVKHNNPCGIACDRDLTRSYEKAYRCDPVSAFGGIYGFTGEVKKDLADAIIENFVEIVLAPAFDDEALSVFARKKNLRVLQLDASFLDPEFKKVSMIKDLHEFGFIVEQELEPPVTFDSFKIVTQAKLEPVMKADVEFAWSVVRHLTSNAIFVARERCSLGFGIGQTNRVQSVRHALQQAGAKARGAVLASDAFFPATDNIEEAARAGIKVIVQPGGSIKDEEVIAAADKAGICMVFTGQRCFRH